MVHSKYATNNRKQLKMYLHNLTESLQRSRGSPDFTGTYYKKIIRYITTMLFQGISLLCSWTNFFSFLSTKAAQRELFVVLILKYY